MHPTCTLCGNVPCDERAVITVLNVTWSPTFGAGGFRETEVTAQSVPEATAVVVVEEDVTLIDH